MNCIFQRLCFISLLAVLAGCASPGDPSTTIRLQATMVSPVDIILEWHDPRDDAAGYILEYTNDPKDEWVPLGYFPPAHKTHTHSRLMQRTKFHYRVRAFHGPASSPVEVSLPQELTDEAYAAGYALPEDYSWAPPRILAETGSVAKHSIRNQSTVKKATPSSLRAELMTPLTVSGFLLMWTDNASDEEGFFLERRIEGSEDFMVCALVEPDINAFGWAFEPPQRTGSFRIRPYYCGEPSNVVVRETGLDPELAHW